MAITFKTDVVPAPKPAKAKRVAAAAAKPTKVKMEAAPAKPAKVNKAKKEAASGGEGTMPQKSPATKKGGARPTAKACVFNGMTVIPEGASIAQAWVSLFLANEKLAKGKKMRDDEIVKVMVRAFNGRETEAFKHPQRVRSKYNAGGFGEVAKVSHRYDTDGTVLTARGSRPDAE